MVASEQGLESSAFHSYSLRICPHCRRPTYFEEGSQFPGRLVGSPVEHLPPDVAGLYEEARACCSHNAFTAAVLLLRKLLMNVAVNKGAAQNLRFIEYVEYLSAKGYVPPDGKGWVDQVREKGNEATHEIRLMGERDAQDLIGFTEMLLKFVYEFPAMIKPLPSKS